LAIKNKAYFFHTWAFYFKCIINRHQLVFKIPFLVTSFCSLWQLSLRRTVVHTIFMATDSVCALLNHCSELTSE